MNEVIKYKLYRGFCVIFGARSFIKEEEGSSTHALVKGDSTKIAGILISQGFTEEWPSGRR